MFSDEAMVLSALHVPLAYGAGELVILVLFLVVCWKIGELGDQGDQRGRPVKGSTGGRR